MKATIKQLVTMLSGLESNLPQDELNELEFEEVQTIIDNLHEAGREFMRFIKSRARVQVVVAENIVDCNANPHIPQGWSLQGGGAGHRKGGMVKLERVVETISTPTARRSSSSSPMVRRKESGATICVECWPKSRY